MVDARSSLLYIALGARDGLHIASTSVATLLAIFPRYSIVSSFFSFAITPVAPAFRCLLCSSTVMRAKRFLFLLPLPHPVTVGLSALDNERTTRSFFSLLLGSLMSQSLELSSPTLNAFPFERMLRTLCFALRSGGGQEGSPVGFFVFSSRSNLPMIDPASLAGR